MAPSKIGVWNVSSPKAVSGKRGSVSVLGSPARAASKAKGQSPEERREKLQPRLGGNGDNDSDEDVEEDDSEIELVSEGEDEVKMYWEMEESEDESDENDDSEGEKEIEMPRTIPNSKGEFRITDWSVIVSFMKKDDTEKIVAILTELGCCGLQWQKRVMYLAYFDSEEALQAVLLRPPSGVPLHSKELHVVWLTGVLDGWQSPKEFHEGIAAACPQGNPLKVRILGTHLAWVRTPTASAAKALLAQKPLSLKAEPFWVEDDQQFHQRCTLRVYGFSREKRFQKRIEASVRDALAGAGVTGWRAFTYNKDTVLVLKQKDVQLAYETLSTRVWSDEVALVRKWDEPAYGLFLSNVPRGTKEDDIRALLGCVAPDRVVCHARKNFAVVYLSSEEERTKCLQFQQSKVNGQRVCMRIMDDHIYPIGKIVDDTYVDPHMEVEDGLKKKKTEREAGKGRGRPLWVGGAAKKPSRGRRGAH